MTKTIDHITEIVEEWLTNKNDYFTKHDAFWELCGNAINLFRREPMRDGSHTVYPIGSIRIVGENTPVIEIKNVFAEYEHRKIEDPGLFEWLHQRLAIIIERNHRDDFYRTKPCLR